MSRIYAQQKRPAAKPAAPSYEAPVSHTPSLVSGASNSDLDALMQAKFQQHFLDNQIPHAEAEADRIAASVSGARTPEEVKSQLGEKMGADFSNVTFHTDSAARGMADTMGARAYTTGNDVYFGSGGFDASVAAHELVHTVQQGVVGSTMQTTSAPTGGVQMKVGLFHRIGNRIQRSWNNKTSMLHPISRHLMAKTALANQNTELYSDARRHKKFSINPFRRHRQVEEALEWQRKKFAPSSQPWIPAANESNERPNVERNEFIYYFDHNANKFDLSSQLLEDERDDDDIEFDESLIV